MSTAFLALWNDYPAQFEEEYETWHTFEHVPERLTAPGILSARRYGCTDGEVNRYFTLYTLDSLQALQHPHYLDLVRRPTDWSLKMRENFLNVLRVPASMVHAAGSETGGSAIVQAWAFARSDAREKAEEVNRFLKEALRTGKVTGFNIGLAEPNQPYDVFQQTEKTDPDTLNMVIVAESTSLTVAGNASTALSQALSGLAPCQCLRSGVFNLLASSLADQSKTLRSDITAAASMRSRFPKA